MLAVLCALSTVAFQRCASLFSRSRGMQDDYRHRVYSSKCSDAGSALLPPASGVSPAEQRRLSYGLPRRPSALTPADSPPFPGDQRPLRLDTLEHRNPAMYSRCHTLDSQGSSTFLLQCLFVVDSCSVTRGLYKNSFFGSSVACCTTKSLTLDGNMLHSVPHKSATGLTLVG